MRFEDVEQSGNTVELPAQRENDLPIEGDGDDDFEIPSVAEYRASVDAVYRDYAIEQGCARVREIEENTISPAMRRIESEDPSRQLVGFENRLKGEERLTEKITEVMQFRGISAGEAFAEVKDAIRFTFQYPTERYTPGTLEDCQRLEEAGFERYDRKNLWAAEQYKGINTHWRDPKSDQMFEVQFHTEASFKAKQETHEAYERLRSGEATGRERDELQDYQRRVSASVPVPPGVTEITSYHPEKHHG